MTSMDVIEHDKGIRLVVLLLPIHGGDREIDPGIEAIGIAIDHRLENPDGVSIVVAGEKTSSLSMRAVEILGLLPGRRRVTATAEPCERQSECQRPDQ